MLNLAPEPNDSQIMFPGKYKNNLDQFNHTTAELCQERIAEKIKIPGYGFDEVTSHLALEVAWDKNTALSSLLGKYSK